jgi:hypothetical protein
MNWWREFDHLSFALVCCVMMLGLATRASPDDLIEMFLVGAFWTIFHSKESSKKPDYRMSERARHIAAMLYVLAIIAAGLLFLNADF